MAPVVQEALIDTPVVCLLGPRQSGKTTRARLLAPDRAVVSPDKHNHYQTAMADKRMLAVPLSELWER